MKKLLNILLLSFLMTFSAIANENQEVKPEVELTPEDFNIPNLQFEMQEGEFYWSQIPTVCGTPDTIEAFLTSKGLSPRFNSVGKAGGDSMGEVVFFVTHWFSDDMREIVATVGVPGDPKKEICMVFHVFDSFPVRVLEKIDA